MNVSVLDPIGKAWERMVSVCFRPFDLNKWLAMGFCAFLAYLGQGGGGVNFPSNLGDYGKKGPGEEFDTALRWLQQNLAAVLLVGAGLLLLGLALGILLQWLSSRGQFMFLDGVLKNRGAVKEPWARFEALGNRLFFFRLWLGLGSVALLLGVLAVGVWAAWPAIRSERFDGRLLVALLGPGCLFLLLALALALLQAVLRDFVVPVMYKMGVGPWQALQIVWGQLVREHLGSFVLFFLMQGLLGIAFGVGIAVVTCLTCCLAALPYIGSVVFLPVFVFFRSYSLYFLEQFGPGWRLWPEGTTDDGRQTTVAGQAAGPSEKVVPSGPEGQTPGDV